MIIEKKFFVPILGVFGTLLLIGAIKDLRRFRMPEKFTPGNKEWLLLHIGNMSGAYIATVTAFLLNNFHVEQPWVLWLGPTIIGLPLISLTVRKWKIKLKL